MWWPFAKRGTRIDEHPAVVLPLALPDDLRVFGMNDACIKLWLPEKLTHAVDALSASHGMSRPDVLRQLIFEHVYGRAALEQLKIWKQKKDAEEAEARRLAAEKRAAEPEVHSGVQFSPPRVQISERAITTQIIGKSIEDFKLWLPAPLKLQLDALAKMESLGISDYLRKTLVRILLGEVFHHKWRQAIGKLPEEIRRLENSSAI